MCLGGDVDSKDGTTKLFFTKRSQDPRAIFDVYGGCATNVYELKLRDGADVCVRKASGDRWEFRYTPVGNALGKSLQSSSMENRDTDSSW